MALRECLDCTALYSIGAVRCPHCNSERGRDQGSDPEGEGTMPKITKHGGASYAGDEPRTETGQAETEQPAPEPDAEAPKPAPKRKRSASTRARAKTATADTTASGETQT